MVVVVVNVEGSRREEALFELGEGPMVLPCLLLLLRMKSRRLDVRWPPYMVVVGRMLFRWKVLFGTICSVCALLGESGENPHFRRQEILADISQKKPGFRFC